MVSDRIKEPFDLILRQGLKLPRSTIFIRTTSCFSRHTMMHLFTADILKVFKNFKQSGSRFVSINGYVLFTYLAFENL